MGKELFTLILIFLISFYDFLFSSPLFLLILFIFFMCLWNFTFLLVHAFLYINYDCGKSLSTLISSNNNTTVYGDQKVAYSSQVTGYCYKKKTFRAHFYAKFHSLQTPVTCFSFTYCSR